MKTLHIAPNHSAGASLVRSIRDADRDDEVLSWPDDLSCGPIDPGDPAERAEWWARFYEDWGIEVELRAFWQRVAAADERLVVWVGRHSAQELAFLLAWADLFRDRPYYLIDVTGLQFPFTRQDGCAALSEPAKSVAIVNADGLRSLLGSEQPVIGAQIAEARRRWRVLKLKNAPFRIVTNTGLVSASVDHFDPLLLAQATTEWRKVAYVVGAAMGFNSEPYYQVGDLMLLTRVVALIDEGKLLADGNPWDMQSCNVRLAGKS
jgi:hypothetical protein